MSYFINALDGAVMPILLILCGIILAFRIRLGKILSPKSFVKTLGTSGEKSGTSPAKALCTALAGTLGVGNIAGVATAITAGGAGAVLWMIIGSVFSMSVKYGEVALAVKYRRVTKDGFMGGAMYTIRHGISKYIGGKAAYVFGGVFALLCISNSLITGNLVQANSAAAALPSVSPYVIGGILASGILIVGLGGASKITSLTYTLIPTLSVVYILMSLSVIFRGASLLPEIICDILHGAFSVNAAAGGAFGLGIKEAVRYGVTRGIFSNEAGCGTSPTAHASADTKSPHHQGCFGIFEVIADTIILCSMTAFVILIAKRKFDLTSLDGVPLTLKAFGLTLGPYAELIIGISVVLFAFATVIAQIYYGNVAIGYFTSSRLIKNIYVVLTAAVSFCGTVVSPTFMWSAADLIVGIMTVINVTVLLLMAGEIAELSPYALKSKKSNDHRSLQCKYPVKSKGKQKKPAAAYSAATGSEI